MDDAAGSHEYVKQSAAQLVAYLTQNTPDVSAVIVAATGATTHSEIEQQRTDLLASFTEVQNKTMEEIEQPYVHYASRFDIVGVYQSVLSKVFSDIPELQGLGGLNIAWLATPLEEGAFKIKSLLHLRGKKTTVLQSIIEVWKEIRFAKAPYPPGLPVTLPLDESCVVALLADWGGDNPAAKRIAGVVSHGQPNVAIHLGDIYYRGVKKECEAFLRNWPLQADPAHPGHGVPPRSSFALNGNHEMYSGGESFFKVVLPALGQLQPFFCPENEHWRLIGLDTAYLGGRLKPTDSGDPMATQWNWLIDLLKNAAKRANIFLSHHQPVSAHSREFKDSERLRADIKELLATEGIGEDAIFGWFFGHEHRCTVYKDDDVTPYNARLIGGGCIPHTIQREVTNDPGCTPFTWVSTRGEDGSTVSASSEYAELRFTRDIVQIAYIDERGTDLGSERWNAAKGRLQGDPFIKSGATYIQT